MMMTLFGICLFFVTLGVGCSAAAREYTLAIVPKVTGNPFFEVVADGCKEIATLVSQRGGDQLKCVVVGSTEFNATSQAQVIDNLISRQDISGIAVSVIDVEIAGAAIDRVVEAGIPVITFDSDAPDSKRSAYVGTNDFLFGASFAWLLSVLRPEGGRFTIISSNAVNTNHRVDGFRSKLQQSFPNSKWIELGDATDCQDDVELALDQALEIAENPEVTAIVAVGGWPMYNPDSTRWRRLVDENPNLLLLVADALPIQLQLLSENYADVLVGQRMFEMGKRVADVLYSLASDEEFVISDEDEKVYTGEEIYIQPGLVISQKSN